MRINRRSAIKTSLALTILSLSRMSWGTSKYPDKPVRWIVPFPAGGPADYLARLVSQHLSKKWGVSIVVENKPGGQTVIGLAELARATPDGYTLGQSIDSSLTMNPFLFSKLPYDAVDDFSHIIRLAELPLMVMTSQSHGASNFEEFVEIAKKSSRSLSYGFPIPGGQIAGTKLSEHFGFDLLPVPYKGTADVVKGLMSGEVDIVIDAIAPYLGYIEQGKIVVLAASGSKRSAAAPNIRSFMELGVPEAQVMVWHGLSAPKGLPKDISLKIQTDVQEVLEQEEVKRKLLELGLETVSSNPAEYLGVIKSEQDRYGPIIKQIGLKVN